MDKCPHKDRECHTYYKKERVSPRCLDNKDKTPKKSDEKNKDNGKKSSNPQDSTRLIRTLS